MEHVEIKQWNSLIQIEKTKQGENKTKAEEVLC